ncbi:dTDP-4-dehydrorhamnose reductase [Williamwhitmania taraxaci]|uniref:dTDP-4-dehydrorhamnose reductase n=1 Tax=Williamwhitmania taraxaci TaxID=1640674 RepID=A0A1G6H6A4_9BACT|nr:dTDP-4-dehydrorhamnose reductase [Williamwhitmania taraxaci]SDB89668.1 dTDP-4-dehydrorhamnose reductase [Williamwhitmania taraxaci]
MKILVTGGNGQLGTELRNLAGLYPELEFIFTDIQELDITNQDQVEPYLKDIKPNWILNCAAYTAVDKAELERAIAMKVNCDAPTLLATLGRELGIGMMHVSTDYVFDGTNHLPYKEFDQVNPQSAYGESKLKGEVEVLRNRGIVIRTSWLYSAYGNNFVKTMLRLGKEKESIGVIFDQIGTPTWAHDLAKAMISMVIKIGIKTDSYSGIYHFSNEGVCSWYDFSRKIMQLSGSPCQVNPIETADYPLPAPRPAYSVLNKKKIKETFKIEIPHWEQSLIKCLNLLLKDKKI